MSLLKKILLAILLLAMAALIGYGLWRMFRSVTPATAPAPAPAGPTGQLPTAGERTPAAAGGAPTPTAGLPPAAPLPGTNPGVYRPALVQQITAEPALFSSLNNNGELRWHDGLDGKFYQVAAGGSIRPMSSQVFYGVKNVTWAHGSDKAVIEYPDGAKTVYDFTQQKQTTLPNFWNDFTFSGDGNQLAAKSMGVAPENRWLVVTNSDGTNTQLVEPLGNNADKVTMDWSPSRQTVALSRTGQPQGADRQEVLFVGLHGENFKSTIVEGLDFQPQWSPTGQKLLYSVDSARSNFLPELWVVDSYGDNIGANRQALQINTWANKCSFGDDNTLFCAVPRTLPQGAGMSPQIANDTPDDLYKIDLKTGVKTPIPLDTNYTFNTISYDATANKVMFTDSHRSGVFQVKL